MEPCQSSVTVKRLKDLGFEIKTGKAEAADLDATISKENAAIGAFNAKIEELIAFSL